MKATTYVDGSYDKNKNLYGYGIVLLVENSDPEFINGYGKAAQGQNGWNINGELKAASVALETAIERGITDLTIYHDYEGIGAWADGKWKTKHDYIRKYINQVKHAREELKIKITFIHVKGHSGNKWNEKADELAAAGILQADKDSVSHPTSAKKKNKKPENKKAEEKSKSVSTYQDDFDLPDGLNPAGAASIRKFLSSQNKGEEEYRQLKTGGMDRFSSMKQEELEKMLGTITCEKIKKRLNYPYRYEAALRWCVRGISAEEAARKVNFDEEAYRK